MKKRNIVLVLAGIIVISVSSFTIISSKFKSANGSKVAYTNSPHDGPGDCSSCHNGGSATPVITFTASPAFGVGNTYVPGTVYTLSYKVTGYPKFGFDLELNAGDLSTSMGAGTNVAVTNCKVTANPYNQGYPANVSHTAPCMSSSAATWHWTAPASGTVYLYSVGVGVNGNNSDSGDRMAQYNLVLTPSTISGITEETANLLDVTLYPNPAVDNIHLTYSLSKRSTVSIELMDMKGQLIETFLNKTQDAGEQSFDKTIVLSKGIE
jgi:hypothetical protein